jgi:hypothetical protein
MVLVHLCPTVDQLLVNEEYPSDAAPLQQVTTTCLVGFQQRIVPVDVLYDAFSKLGFVHSFPAGEWSWDVA